MGAEGKQPNVFQRVIGKQGRKGKARKGKSCAHLQQAGAGFSPSAFLVHMLHTAREFHVLDYEVALTIRSISVWPV